MSAAAASPDAKRRVKLYALNQSRQWDDKGTGHVTSCYHEPLDGMSLLVRNELDGSLLLESKIQLDTHYQKQQGTLIVWTESDNYDLALSFQEQGGCDEIWEKICQVQGRDPTYEPDNDEEQEEFRINLIECDYDKLQSILEQITACSQISRRRDVLASEYLENDYINQLIDIFRKADEKQDLEALHKLYEIFKQLFLFDRPTLTEAMLSENIIMDVIGVFEYEPPSQQQQQQQQQSSSSSSQQQTTTNDTTPPTASNEQTQLEEPQVHRKKHREFLKNEVTFKEVIPFSNQKLVDKIHQLYRVQYLQSSVLPAPSILEDNVYASLTNILFFNKVEIVSMIQENEEYLRTLFNQITSNETELDRKRELVLFLKEYCTFSQTIQPKQREMFFKTLASLRILSAVEVALSSNDQTIKFAAIDIFTYLVEYNPHMTRDHAVQQREGLIDPPNSDAQTAHILKLVVEKMTTDQDPELGVATQLSCIIKLIMDPENMACDGLGKRSFLEFFYATCMQSLVEPIKNSTTTDGDIEPSANDRKTAQLLSIMLELLTFFMEHHYMQLRTYILENDLVSRVVSLIKSRHKFLVLSVVRFIRQILGKKDRELLTFLADGDLLNPIVQALRSNKGRYNLIDSAILEMFEFITNDNLDIMIDYIMDNYGPELESIDYVNTFKVMRQRKESNKSNPVIDWIADDDIQESPHENLHESLHESNYEGIGEEVDEVDEVDEEEDEDDDIQLDEDCSIDELEPQLKKKKTK